MASLVVRGLLSRALLKSFRNSGALCATVGRHGNGADSRTAHTAASPVPEGITQERFSLNHDTINPNLKRVQYAVRGPVLDRAMEIERELRQGVGDYPFKEIIYCNIGDVQAMGHQPITYIRQLIAVCLNPGKYFEAGSDQVRRHGNTQGMVRQLLGVLADNVHSEEDREKLLQSVDGLSEAAEERVSDIIDDIPSDVKERANILLNSLGGSYTDSQGIAVIRQHVADFITRRDGYPGDPSKIFLLNGATEGIKAVFYMCMDPDVPCGVMIPIPQYPIYTASISEFGAEKIEYCLEEERDWAVDVGDMRRRVREARGYCQPRILAVINPGNPTGQCLTGENIREIVQLCQEEGLVIIADEVYQENIYDDAIQFTSFRKAVKEMKADVQLVSIHSVSKGYTGECGVRGGYMELLGFDDVMDEINKLFRTKLCANTMGQVVTDAMVNPPEVGSPSYQLYKEERERTQVALRRKAELVHRRFNSIPGVTCRRLYGAMYAFPRIHLPPQAIAEAENRGMSPDQYYCMQFLEQKGVCVVPGSGFGQKEGTWHFRTTILPSEEDLERMLDLFADFHTSFTNQYSDSS